MSHDIPTFYKFPVRIFDFSEYIQRNDFIILFQANGVHMPPLARGQGLCDIDSLELLKKFQNNEESWYSVLSS